MTRPLAAPGRLVAGRYRLQSQIGGGGMGTVWLARDELLGRQVAVKQVLSPAGSNDKQIDEQRQRALREGRIAARLSHPHAISVYDVALEGGQPWLVMEYLPSRSLAAVLTEDGVLHTAVVAQIGAQVADALAATHAAGIVHRDVKPANILIGEGGRVEGLVKITDFGISHASGDVTLTQTGQITGTPAFLSPEVAQGRPMTEASDVFSLGATLYTCLEGQPPFGMEDNALAMLHRVAGGNIRPPLRAGSMATPLTNMLAAEPEDRPTMTEVRDELASLAAGRDGDPTTVLLARADLRPAEQTRNPTSTFPAPPPVLAPTPPPPPPRTLKQPSEPSAVPASGTRRTRAIWVAAAAVALVLAGLIVFWAVALDEGDPAVQENPSATTSEAPPTSDSAEQTTTEQSQASPEPPPDDGAAEDALDDKNIRDFLQDYHAAVLSDPRTAYDTLTGPTLQANVSYETYAEFWGRFSDVKVKKIEAEDGSRTATAVLEFTEDGERFEEAHRFTLAVGEDGSLLMDVDEQTG